MKKYLPFCILILLVILFFAPIYRKTTCDWTGYNCGTTVYTPKEFFKEMYFNVVHDEITGYETSGWKTYTDSRYPFSFKYPSELSVLLFQAPQQWQVQLIKPDANIVDGRDTSEYIASIWVEEWTANIDDVLKEYDNDHSLIQTKRAETTVDNQRAVLIALCEIGMPYDPPCELPDTDEEMLEKGTRMLIANKDHVYTVTLPWWSDDLGLFYGILSTLTFEE